MRINSVPDVKCFCNNKNVLCAQSMVWHFVRHPVCLRFIVFWFSYLTLQACKLGDGNIFKCGTGLKQNIIILKDFGSNVLLLEHQHHWLLRLHFALCLNGDNLFSLYLICSIKSRQWNILGSYVLLNGTDCCMSDEWEWMKKESLCVWGSYKFKFHCALWETLLVLSCCSASVALLKSLYGTLSVGILLLSSRPARVGINRWNPVCSSVSKR